MFRNDDQPKQDEGIQKLSETLSFLFKKNSRVAGKAARTGVLSGLTEIQFIQYYPLTLVNGG